MDLSRYPSAAIPTRMPTWLIIVLVLCVAFLFVGERVEDPAYDSLLRRRTGNEDNALVLQVLALAVLKDAFRFAGFIE